jgi:hypothetical protein
MYITLTREEPDEDLISIATPILNAPLRTTVSESSASLGREYIHNTTKQIGMRHFFLISQSEFQNTSVVTAPINYILAQAVAALQLRQLSYSFCVLSFYARRNYSKRLIRATGPFESPCSCRRMQPAAPSSRDCCLSGRERRAFDDQ